MLDPSISFIGPERQLDSPRRLFPSQNKQALEAPSKEGGKEYLFWKHFPREIKAITHHYLTNRVS